MSCPIINDKSNDVMAGDKPKNMHIRNTMGHNGKNACNGNVYPWVAILKYNGLSQLPAQL